MTTLDEALSRLRASDLGDLPEGPLRTELTEARIGFVALGGPLEDRWRQALRELHGSIRPLGGRGQSVLTEGGPYAGAWIESTGSISTEVLTRFAPRVARATSEQFAAHQRGDGLIPYKLVDSGPGFTQIQLVTPFARTVWNHYLLTGRDRDYLRRQFAAMTAMDAWLATHRNTRGTGGVEAFGTFDTGHDLSPRFWFVPDRPLGDATTVDPSNPILPLIAPDLTANVAAQRAYLTLIASELGEDAARWERAAAESTEALFRQCWDPRDGMFYDRDARGDLRRVQSDVLLRVLECEVGDDAFFAAALERYLLHTGKFLAHYGFTSLALDDPRFDTRADRNSWGGPVNFLSLLRAPHPFEHHARVAELALVSAPVLAAVALGDRFPQCLDPWTGAAGFTSEYSPSILWFLDALERHAGILPRSDGTLWFSGMPPTRLDHGAAARAVGYARLVDGVRFELVADDARVVVFRDGAVLAELPRGWRLVTDRAGTPLSLVGLGATPTTGTWDGADVVLGPNDILDLASGTRRSPGFTAPRV